jgi:hypothetical protein
VANVAMTTMDPKLGRFMPHSVLEIYLSQVTNESFNF